MDQNMKSIVSGRSILFVKCGSVVGIVFVMSVTLRTRLGSLPYILFYNWRVVGVLEGTLKLMALQRGDADLKGYFTELRAIGDKASGSIDCDGMGSLRSGWEGARERGTHELLHR